MNFSLNNNSLCHICLVCSLTLILIWLSGSIFQKPFLSFDQNKGRKSLKGSLTINNFSYKLPKCRNYKNLNIYLIVIKKGEIVDKRRRLIKKILMMIKILKKILEDIEDNTFYI